MPCNFVLLCFVLNGALVFHMVGKEAYSERLNKSGRSPGQYSGESGVETGQE